MTLGNEMAEEALECVMDYVNDPRDRSVVSQVCKQWYMIDALTRKHVTVAFCYTIKPADLTRRFRRLESLKLKGMPRAAMFNLIPEDWGAYASPWIEEISSSCLCLKSLHLRRIIVKDADLATLVGSHGQMLQALKLEKCCGFSTLGLLEISRSCRSLKVLFLEESEIKDEGGEWLHELALRNISLEVLNFYVPYLESINMRDLELIATNCRALTSLRVNECDILELRGVLDKATELEEFGGGSFQFVNSDEHALETDTYRSVKFPSKVISLIGLNDLSETGLPFILPRACNLKKLDLQFTYLSTESHCELLCLCTGLEVLEVRNGIGDRGLEVVANHCKKLRRLRVEPGEEEGEGGEQSSVSHRGLSTVAQGCLNLEFIAVYVTDISNLALETVGEYCKNLRDFRLVLLDKEEQITDLPLDNGVMALLRGCSKLNRFGLYLRHGGLTDTGLGYIGKYSANIRWMLLGFVGECDQGLLEFSKGCLKLERLEMRGCCFSESAIAAAVQNLKSLKYIWVQGYKGTTTGEKLLAMSRPFWNIEFTPPLRETGDELDDMEEAVIGHQPAQILAYYSLAGRRTDNPKSVILLSPHS
jgi:coronatine-insensitive protein 1